MRLIVFDVDGTLVDSQKAILTAMRAAYETVGRTPPSQEKILSMVGLTLEVGIALIDPDVPDPGAIADAYRAAYNEHRKDLEMPLYPGAAELLARLAARPDLLLGVATGKARRGLDRVLSAHDLAGTFVTLQTADLHPSKPAPAMLEAAMNEVGVEPQATVMIGDTEFDMEMARAAKVRGIGVLWGYHGVERLGAAQDLVEDMGQLEKLLEDIT